MPFQRRFERVDTSAPSLLGKVLERFERRQTTPREEPFHGQLLRVVDQQASLAHDFLMLAARVEELDIAEGGEVGIDAFDDGDRVLLKQGRPDSGRRKLESVFAHGLLVCATNQYRYATVTPIRLGGPR